MALDRILPAAVTRGSIKPAQPHGAPQLPPSNGRLSPMKWLAIEPESSNVTTMFGGTAWVTLGGVGLSSTMLLVAAVAGADARLLLTATSAITDRVVGTWAGADNPPRVVSTAPIRADDRRPATN